MAVHPDETLPEKYQARVTPFAFLIDGEGTIQAKGLANNREHLEMLLDLGRETSGSAGKAGRNGVTEEEERTVVEEAGP